MPSKRNIFLGKHFADPTIKIQPPPTQISIKKINTHPWPKFCKRVPFSCHTCLSVQLLWREFDNCLETLFAFGHINVEDSDSDWFTYCIGICFLVFNIWMSHTMEMTTNFYYPTLGWFCFPFTQPFTHLKCCFTIPFVCAMIAISRFMFVTIWWTCYFVASYFAGNLNKK